MHEKRQEREAKDKEDGEGKRKVEQFPAEFILVSRTVELLQGICSITGHQVHQRLCCQSSCCCRCFMCERTS